MHGKSKRRTWRKLHLGVDEQSGGIVAAVLSGNNVSDGEVLPQLLDQVEEPISQLSGDFHNSAAMEATTSAPVMRFCKSDRKNKRKS